MAKWIFGYGSLLWKQDFPFEESCPALVRGWERRFWQGSTDHRGLPHAPGRVVTLTPLPGGACQGLAFRVRDDELEAVLAYLDHRERDGYRRIRSNLHLGDGRLAAGIFYIAEESNPRFLGDASIEAMAEQVRGACGLSGPNAEYICRLASSLRELRAYDHHVFALERLLLEREGRTRATTAGDGPK